METLIGGAILLVLGYLLTRVGRRRDSSPEPRRV
jgi:hypothetical protein